METIDTATVKHVALLSRLSLDEKELSLHAKQLTSILSYISKLNEIETYDSVGQLSVIALFDSLFDIVISAKDLTQCKTVSDLLYLVKDKLS